MKRQKQEPGKIQRWVTCPRLPGQWPNPALLILRRAKRTPSSQNSRSEYFRFGLPPKRFSSDLAHRFCDRAIYSNVAPAYGASRRFHAIQLVQAFAIWNCRVSQSWRQNAPAVRAMAKFYSTIHDDSLSTPANTGAVAKVTYALPDQPELTCIFPQNSSKPLTLTPDSGRPMRCSQLSAPNQHWTRYGTHHGFTIRAINIIGGSDVPHSPAVSSCRPLKVLPDLVKILC